MKKMKLSLIILLGINSAVYAQNKADLNNIEQLCGCFSVDFKYAETFSPDDAYKYHERDESHATELVLPIQTSDKHIVLQHLLVIMDTMIVKHWREEWVYEAPYIYEYIGNRVWKKKELTAGETKGTWAQTVWEVSDEPRYQGVSKWVTVNGKTYWENTADAPLPRREYTVRNDYNVLKRRNRIAITDEGYVHEQDNEKLLREGKKDKLIAQEKGFNTYVKIKDKECKAAYTWWKKNQAFWEVVRSEWEKYLATAPVVTLKPKADDQMMNEHFSALWKEWSRSAIPQQELEGRIKEVLVKFQ